jgi:Ran GTPase-activating protein (RanGAP) involved in mRNA processing and transport
LKKLQLWKAEFGDEGVRVISKFILGTGNALEFLDLLDNQITQLGCEFLGKALLSP